MLDFLYETDDMKKSIGSDFLGPHRLEHGKETLLAIFDKQPDSDGYTVELYCTSMPAMFFRIKAFDTNDSVGDKQSIFQIATGSGMFDWALETAKLIRDGMLEVNPK